jgi:hypothetical protein
MEERFDYVILNEDNEWLGYGKQETQGQLEQELSRIKQEQFDRWGEELPLIVFKAKTLEKQVIYK